MSQFVFIVLSCTAVVACLMALRMYGDWLAITACSEGGDYPKLMELRESLNCWAARHLLCAVAASALCVAVRLVPSLHIVPGIDALMAGYGILSLLFASLDHALSRQVLLVIRQDGYGGR